MIVFVLVNNNLCAIQSLIVINLLYSILNEWKDMRRNYMRNSNVNKRDTRNCSIRKQRKNYSKLNRRRELGIYLLLDSCNRKETSQISRKVELDLDSIEKLYKSKMMPCQSLLLILRYQFNTVSGYAVRRHQSILRLFGVS